MDLQPWSRFFPTEMNIVETDALPFDAVRAVSGVSEDGNIIKVTEDHSIMVLDEKGEPTIEKKPSELTVDDVCLVIG